MQDVFDFIDAHVDGYLERLKDLCRQQTIAVRRQGITEGAERLAAMLRDIGAEPQLVPVGETTYVVTRVPGAGERTLGFYNHFDTHPPEPLEAWESPPFEPTVRDGALYARGASDNKGNVVARICAVEAYQEVRGQMPLSAIFLHDGEEEIGSPNMATFLEQHAEFVKDADGWVWEGGFKDANEQLEVYLGFNGILYVELEATAAGEDTHGSHAGLVPNAAWRLVWALGTLKAPDENILIDGFADAVMPATEEDLALLKALPVDPEAIKREFQISKWAGDSSWEAAQERQHLYPYINMAGIGAGHQGEGVKVILPHRATAKLGIYLVPDQDPGEVLAQLRTHLDARGFEDVHVKPLAKMPPSRTSASTGLAQAVVNLVSELYEKPAVLYPIMPGASPMGHLTGRFGVPGVSTGVGYVNSRIHQPNENVRIHDFVQGIKFIAVLIDRMGQPGQVWD
jgi:acetylornithine deacetylase/succinyl-diaminopimelate desuccinylase-like protein